MQQGGSVRDRFDQLRSIARHAARFYGVGLAGIVAGTSIALAVALLMPRLYKSETLMLYREGIRSADVGANDSGGGDPARRLGMKLKELVLSRTSLQETIDRFHLYPNIVAAQGYVDAVDEMRSHIVFRIKDGETFGLSFEGPEAALVQEVTAQLAAALIAQNSKTRLQQATLTKEFLDTEKTHNEEELKGKETELGKFLAKHPEFARDTTAGSGPYGDRFHRPGPVASKGSDGTLMALERQADRIATRLAGRTSTKEAAPLAADPKLTAQRGQAENELQNAQRDLADKLSQFTEQHPDVRAAETRVKAAELKLARAEATLAAGLKPGTDEVATAPVAAVDRIALEKELAKIKAEMVAVKSKKKAVDAPEGATAPTSDASYIVALETDWSRLNREVSEARERQKQVEDKQFRAVMAANSISSDGNSQMLIVDPAYLPTHSSRQTRTAIVAAGFAASLALSLMLMLGCALLDDRIYGRVDLEPIESELQIKLLAVIPPTTDWQRSRKAQHG